MDKEEHKHLKGALLAAAAFSLFSIGDALIKSISGIYSFYVMIFFISLFAIGTLLIFSSPLDGLRETLKSRKIPLHLLRGFFFFLQFPLIIFGLSHLPMTKFYALVFVTPFLTSLIAIPVLKERVQGRSWLAIFVGFFGVLIVLRPGLIPLDMPSLAVLGLALFSALVNIMVRVIGAEETKLSFALFPEALVFVAAGCLVLLTGGFEIPAGAHLFILAAIGCLSATGMVLIAMAFSYAPASVAAPFHYIQMLWALLFGYFIFDDALDIWTGVGAAIIILSGIWLLKHGRGIV